MPSQGSCKASMKPSPRGTHTSWQTEGHQGQPVSLISRTQKCRLRGMQFYYTKKATLGAQLIPRPRVGKAMLHEQRNPQQPKTPRLILQEFPGCQEPIPSSAFFFHLKPDSIRAVRLLPEQAVLPRAPEHDGGAGGPHSLGFLQGLCSRCLT